MVSSLDESQGCSRLAEKHKPFSVSCVFPLVSSWWDVLGTSHQGGILSGCFSLLNWLLDVEEQWLFSEPFLDDHASYISSREELGTPTKETHFLKIFYDDQQQ